MLTPCALLCVLGHPPGAQFSEQQVLRGNAVQQGAGYLREMDAAQLTTKFNWRYALCIQKLYHKRTSQSVGAEITAPIFNRYNDATVRTR